MVPRVVLAGMALVLVAACGESSEPEAVVEDAPVASLVDETAVASPDLTAATTSTAPGSSGETVESQTTATPASTSTLVTTTVGDPDHVTVAVSLWDVSIRPGADGMSLQLFFVGGPAYEPGDPCTERYVPTVTESATEVSVAIRGESPKPWEGAACLDLGYPRSVTVELSQPLGDRLVIVGGQAVPRTATLTLIAQHRRGYGTTGREGIVLAASGAGGTLSGPSGVSGELPPGTYDLSVTPPDELVTINGIDLRYKFDPASCSDTPSGGVFSVTLDAGGDVTCHFFYDLIST